MPNKQKIGLIIYFSLIVISYFSPNQSLKFMIIGIGLPLVIMGVGPFLYEKINFPIRFRYIPLLVAMVLPLLLFKVPIKWTFSDISSYIFVCLLTLILLLSRLNKIKEAINVAYILDPISTKLLVHQLTKIITFTICEELLFRVFFFHYISNPGLTEIILGAIIFTYYHYFNRYASSTYTFLDYLYHFFLSIILGISFIYFDNLVLPIIFGHLVYNSINIITLLIQKNNSSEE